MKARVHDRRAAPSPAPPARWREALAKLTAPGGRPDWPLDIVLVDDPEIARLNREWRARDEVTDVLSFSYLETAGAGPPALRAGQAHAASDLWRGPGDDAAAAPAGELVLAPDFVVARCVEHGWDEAAEWALLTVHGLLHVIGWTHDGPRDSAAMRARETELLKGAGFAHPLAAGGPPAGEEAGNDGSGDA